MTPARRRLFGFILAGAVVLFALGWFFVDVTARRSTFCAKCHYMEPYVEQWKASSHKEVECVRCHPTSRRAMLAQFVKYATGTHNPRPRAHVPDSACTARACHAQMPQSKAVTFMNVTFPHQPHLAADRRGIRLRCASCHGSSREAGHVLVDTRVCFLCHFKGQSPGGTLAQCGSCHGAPSGQTKHGGFVFDMKSYVESGVQCSRCHLVVHEGEGAVSKDHCYNCHVSRAEKISESKMLHEKHVDASHIRCLECHEPIRHGNIKVLSVLDVACESCHSNLHAGPKEMYLGVGAKGAPSTPSRMFAAQINCVGCHTQITTQGGMAFLGQGSKSADPRACAACHDARFIPMVDRWKAQGAQLAAEAARLAAEGKRLAAANPKNAGAQAAAADLAFNAEFLRTGHPVHNIEYAVKVVQASGALLDKAAADSGGKSSGVQYPPRHGPFSYCQESCHTFIPRPEPLIYKGVDFPHAFHVQKAALSCDTCHKEGRHMEMALAGPKDCVSCHHDSAKADCARCHSRQAALLKGKLPASLNLKAKPDKMAEVGCADCHDPTKPDALKDVSKACLGCHSGKGESGYYANWQAKIKAGRERVRNLLDEANMVLAGMKRHGASTDALRRKVKAVEEQSAYLERGREVHNMAAAEAFFDRAAKELEAVLKEAQSAGPVPGPTASR